MLKGIAYSDGRRRITLLVSLDVRDSNIPPCVMCHAAKGTYDETQSVSAHCLNVPSNPSNRSGRFTGVNFRVIWVQGADVVGFTEVCTRVM